jgi:mRNA interferase RelE/StbE
LVGSTANRLRVGDFRAIFEESDTEIFVTKIAPRGSA